MAKKAENKEVVKNQNQPNDDFKTISENLPFHNFNERPVFTGMFEKSLTLGEKEPFEAFVFADSETGERVFITASHAIQKAVANVRSEHENLNDVLFRFEFKGKTMVNGKPFNQFTTAYKITK